MTRKPIVVAVDGSPASDAAISWAAAEAVASSNQLKVVHAFIWPLFRVPVGPSEIAPGLRAAAEHILQEAVEIAEKAEPGLVVGSELITGFPAPVLVAESQHAELVVIGSRGVGSALGLLVGSTGIDLAAGAHCPVAVVRPGTPVITTNSHVLVGYDGSAPADHALAFGIDFAKRHDCAVRVVIVEAPHALHERVNFRELRLVVGRLAGDVPLEIVRVQGHPAAQLLELAADADLTVVGSRGRGGFEGLLLGSVSQSILHHAQCPVVVIPPRA